MSNNLNKEEKYLVETDKKETYQAVSTSCCERGEGEAKDAVMGQPSHDTFKSKVDKSIIDAATLQSFNFRRSTAMASLL
jgi:hypothetical protein